MMLDTIVVLRASYLVAAAAVLLIKCVPFLRTRFLAYGSRQNGQQPRKSATNHLFDAVAAVQVPHGWFASFYVASTMFSLLWLSQVVLDRPLWRGLAASTNLKNTMTLDQVLVTWIMMLLQGSRRLYESLAFTKPSNSRMWVGHWALGIWFYASMSVAVWIEGAPTLLEESFEQSHFLVRPLTLRTFIGSAIFILASGVQHDCHAFLASLKKYSVPEHPVFHRVVCPHYFVECLIYLSLAIVAAPGGHLLNWTIVCALVFVGINLGVTADGTKRWYMDKFGSDSVSERWRMIPFLY